MHTAVLLEKIKSIRKPGGRPWPTMICYFEMIAACEQAEHTRHAPPSVVPLSRAELAERMGCSKQRITQYMQALEEVGLVERELLPKGRGVIYHVNPLVSTWGRPDSVTAQVVEFEHLQRTNAKKRETQMELV